MLLNINLFFVRLGGTLTHVSSGAVLFRKLLFISGCTVDFPLLQWFSKQNFLNETFKCNLKENTLYTFLSSRPIVMFAQDLFLIQHLLQYIYSKVKVFCEISYLCVVINNARPADFLQLLTYLQFQAINIILHWGKNCSKTMISYSL